LFANVLHADESVLNAWGIRVGLAKPGGVIRSPSRSERVGSVEFSNYSDDSAYYLGIDAGAQPNVLRTLRRAAER